MKGLLRRKRARGWSLVEHLVAMSLVGGLVLSVGPLIAQVTRESSVAGGRADALAARWETVRRLRSDASQATAALPLQAEDGQSAGVELRSELGSVSWVERDGLLHRAASPGPVVQPVAMTAVFGVESRQGRSFLSYLLEDEAGRLSGSVLIGSAP